MIRRAVLGFILATVGILHAQENPAQIKPKTILDSLNSIASKQWLTDSLSINAWGDSLKSGIEANTTQKLANLNHKVDSLKSLNLSTEAYTQKIDSIRQKKEQLLAEVREKQQNLFGKSKGNIGQWQSKIKNDLRINTLNLPATNLPNVKLPTDLAIPSLQLDDFQKWNLSPELSGLTKNLPFNSVGGLKEFQVKLGSMPDLKSVAGNPDKVIENVVTNIDGVSEIKDKLNVNGLDNSELGKVVQSAQNPEALKATAIEEAKKEAINHFAGKEQALQSAMEQVSKYKQKYASVGSLSEVQNLKRPPNPMKGKPFVERFVPGFAMQIHTKRYLNFDINPFGAYRVTGKLNVGLGWNQRLAMDWSTKKIVPNGRVYGPRTFVDYKLPRGFGVRVEAEWLNSFVPPFALGGGDGHRQWVFSTMTGLKKDYRFFNRVKGFTIVQFDIVRLIKPNNTSPYSDVVNTRFGFEFPLKKKPKANL